MGFIIGLVWVLFVVSGILLCVVILLQEGKGGGLAEAFGGAGAEVFGVKAGGINKVTSVLAAVFLGSIVLIDACQRRETLFPGGNAPPSAPAPGTPPGSGGGSQTPAPPAGDTQPPAGK
ncbi:MAG: preprotein translocase subunit SecG [Planctomycetota bacterium]